MSTSHSTQHLARTWPLLSCTFEGCGRTFRSNSGLTQHLRASHQSTVSSPLAIPVVSSSHCTSSPAIPVASSERFSSPGVDYTLFQCPFPQCGGSFRTRAGLTLHTRTFHPDPVQSTSPISIRNSFDSTTSSLNCHPLPENGENQNIVRIISAQLINVLTNKIVRVSRR